MNEDNNSTSEYDREVKARQLAAKDAVGIGCIVMLAGLAVVLFTFIFQIKEFIYIAAFIFVIGLVIFGGGLVFRVLYSDDGERPKL